jgi:RNA-directed DNA polymerase
MTTLAMPMIGASLPDADWDAIDWRLVERSVLRLQVRIAKAVREGSWGKVKALQWLLTHSYRAKLLAVRRVTQNAGRHTPGVDGVVWKTSAQKLAAVRSLRRQGYQTQPLRRVYIPKRNGQQRPLGIPAMRCRALQALHRLALEPVAEMLADPNSYGFRPRRSVADAIGQCFVVLSQKQSAQWILEGDIKACFDRISHAWLEEHIPMDRGILGKWLAAGYMEAGAIHPTREGTPQGGIISPTLANRALDGLEATAREAAPRNQKIHVIRYADDFIITGASMQVLATKIKPAVEAFLKARGLELSVDKTRITQIDDGFDFLGFNVRKYAGKLLIKPAAAAVKRLLTDVRQRIKASVAEGTAKLIRQLNQKLSGWAHYYRHVVAKKTFNHIDHEVYRALRAWVERRHPGHSSPWKRHRYFRRADQRDWTFFARIRDRSGQETFLDLFSAAALPIIRHVKIKAQATPYDPVYARYFAQRAKGRKPDLRTASA